MVRSTVTLFALLTAVAAQNAYNDSFARNVMFPLSAAAYADDPQKCLTNKAMATLKRKLVVTCDDTDVDTCIGFTASSDSNKAIIISFKGTDEFLQLVEEGLGTVFNDEIAVPGGGKVSNYFWNAFNALWTHGLKDDFLSLAAKNPTYDLWITGHSLGGAMASICAQVIAAQSLYDPKKINLMTFGQPRTGEAQYSKTHDQLVPNSIRVTHHRDVVPHIPPQDLSNFVHHKQEVWYTNGMKPGDKFIVCQQDEDQNCSDGNLFNLGVDDHLHYFEQSVFDIGNMGCV